MCRCRLGRGTRRAANRQKTKTASLHLQPDHKKTFKCFRSAAHLRQEVSRPANGGRDPSQLSVNNIIMSLFLFTDIRSAGPTAGSKLSLIPCPQHGSVTVRLQVQLQSLCNEWVTVHVSFLLCSHSVCAATARMDSDTTAISRAAAERLKIWKNKVWQKMSHVSIREPHWQQSRMLHEAQTSQEAPITPYHTSPWAHSHRLFDKAYLKRRCNIFGFKIQHVCDPLAVWSLFRWRSSKASPALSKTLEATAEELRCQYVLCQRWASPPERFLMGLSTVELIYVPGSQRSACDFIAPHGGKARERNSAFSPCRFQMVIRLQSSAGATVNVVFTKRLCLPVSSGSS